MFVAKPNIPKEIVEQTAKKIRYSKIYEMRLREYTDRKKKKGNKDKTDKLKHEKRKDTKSTETKSKKTTKNKKEKQNKKSTGDEKPADAEPQIVITDKDLECDYLDFYPAEMVYWRNLHPYYIKANFTCVVNYEHKTHKVSKKRDKLYLEATCKVVRPDFSTNLQLQKIDFGKCLIGSTISKTILLQNITYENIKPEVSLLNPVGSFSHCHIKDLEVPPEYSLNLPINFKPSNTDQVVEYFEIKSNATIMPLVLCGEGVDPVLHVSPQFEIFRMETKRNKLAELQLKIDNNSIVDALITFKKLFEIQASLADIAKVKSGDEVEKIEEKINKKDKSKKAKVKEKAGKYSNDLTNLEVEVINTCFKKSKKGEVHFDFKTANHVSIRPHATSSVTILCGEPELIKNKKAEGPKKGKGAKEKKEHKSDKGSDIEKKLLPENQYIVQYNIYAGTMFIKRIVIFCTIKN